jgi:dTDP-4-amino-4,6-dideoxygalactose transaminase/acyl-CoA-binding protein/nucleoside-diphosphate-sugar epimerase
MIDLEELFETVVILVRETPESSFEHPTSTAEKVELYGLYKHVREGPCDGHDLPSVFYAVARAKYQAWRACESLTAQEAMMEYIQLAASKDHWKTKALLEEYQRETKDSNTTTTISSLRSVFDNVASFVRDEHTTPGLELSSATALQLEGLYKHLTVGTCVSDVLATLDATEKAQHQAWWACKQKSKEQAMLEYIQSVASYQDHWVGRKAQELLQDYRQLQRSKSFAEGNVEESLENEHPKSVSATIINANDNAHDTPIIQATTASEENESKPTHGIKLAVSKSVVRPTAKENIAVDPKPSRFSVYTTYLFGLFGVHPLIPRGQIDISYSDLFFALMQCCRYWRSSMIRYQTLYQQIQDVWSFDGSGVAVGLSARSLLDLYLCLKKYPAGSEVIMIPPISVPGMCHVLKYHDLSIIPVDCPLGISLEATQEAITDKTVAIMVVHAFGKIYASPEEFQQLRQLADAHNVELWEDGAECFAGLGESCYRGSVCADLRFCSFGMIKTATAIGGGVVLLRDKAFAKQMQGLQHSFYKQQSASEYLSRIVMGLIIKTLGASPLLYGLLAAICSLLGLNFDSFVTALLRGFVIQSPSSNSVKDKRDEERQIQSHMVQQIRKRPSPALLAVLHRRLKQSRRRTPGIDARLNRCQRMAAILQERVPDMTIQYTQACTEHTYWLFPIRCHNRESVSRQMLKAGFDVAQGASQLCCVSKFTDEGMCPESEKLMSELLYLPVSSRNLSEAMMAELARALQIASTMAGKGDSTASQNVLHLKTAKMLNLPVAIGAIAHLAFLHSSKSGSFLQPLIGLITMILGTSICVLLIFAIGLLVLRWLAASFYLESRSFAKYSNLVQESECGVRSIDAENKTTNAIDTHPHVLSSPMGTLNVPDTQVTNKSVIQFMTALKFPRTSVLGQSTTNKVILTGATGFIGSLLLRDILMHREALSIGGGVIILCRKKRNESAQARIQKLLADPMFAFLSDEDKRKLVHVVQGDVTHPEAGLSPGDIELVCEDPSISHVFHCAASVSFTQDLPGAAKANITSSLNIQSLTGKLKNEDVQYVQISTAFIHGGLSGTAVLPLHEKLHSLSPYDPVEIYKSMLGTQFYASKAMHDLGFPNTYTFSKCVCEHLLLQESPVSTMIVRPSIVGPSIESPFEGWAGEKPSTLVAAACLYMGYQWTLWCFGSHSVPYIPVDILSRFILAKAFSDKEEEGTGDSSANESLSTDDTFERISGASDIFSDSGYELLTTSLKIKNFRHGRIYNAVWDTKSAHTALFSWHEYAVATLQLGVVLRYLDRATAYFGLFVSTRLMPSLQLSTESFALVHSVLVLGPIRIILKLCRFVGYAPKHLSKLSLFLDLPLLFFPFTNKSFHFRSELIAPDTVDGERYLFSCAVAAHRFLVAAQSRTRPANGKKSADSAVEASQDMTKLIVGGCAHDALCSDIWWALSQPRGSYFIRLAGYFFRKILRAAASVVTVDATSFAPAIAALCSKDNANVYLILAPTHRSFFDFILLSYLFFELPELCIDIPFVAAAEEFERLPLVGWVARSLRAFYIERGRGNADPQLTATLEDLKQKQLSSFGSCLEVFLEGTRSRDRRFVHPRTGFLKCLKQSGGGHLVVPITICYEGIPEQNVLAEEAAGTSRRKLNLGGMFLWLKVGHRLYCSKQNEYLFYYAHRCFCVNCFHFTTESCRG